jgi:hypothetical protein
MELILIDSRNLACKDLNPKAKSLRNYTLQMQKNYLSFAIGKEN